MGQGVFQVGDLVECIDASPHRNFPDRYSLTLRAIYRIARFQNYGAVEVSGSIAGWAPERFRKIEAPDTEVARQIRACRPVHDPVSV